MEPLPLTGSAEIDRWFALLGIVMSAASTVASALNARIRSAVDMGETVPTPFVYLALAANYAALNIDKCGQLHRLLRGGSMVVTHVSRATQGNSE